MFFIMVVFLSTLQYSIRYVLADFVVNWWSYCNLYETKSLVKYSGEKLSKICHIELRSYIQYCLTEQCTKPLFQIVTTNLNRKIIEWSVAACLCWRRRVSPRHSWRSAAGCAPGQPAGELGRYQYWNVKATWRNTLSTSRWAGPLPELKNKGHMEWHVVCQQVSWAATGTEK